MLHPREARLLVPRPGTVLVERDQEPEMATRHIITPVAVQMQRKASTGTVWATGARVTSVRVGDRVLIGGGVGKKVKFGDRGELVLYHCRPEELSCRLHGEEPEMATEDGQHPLGRDQALDAMDHELLDDRRDHGGTYHHR